MTDEVAGIVPKEHIIDESLLRCTLQRLFKGIKEDSVKLLDVLLLLAFPLAPAKRFSHLLCRAGSPI